MSVGTRRICAWLVGTLSLLVVVALIVAAAFNLQVGDSTSSVIVGITAVIGFAISTITLITNSTKSPVRSSAMVTRIRSKGDGALAVGGSIRGNAIGKNSKVAGPASTSPSTAAPSSRGFDVRARGTGAMSAGGDMADNAMGEGSER
jgi:hypothetical protein